MAMVIVALDQMTKLMIVQNFSLGDSHTITSFFNLVRVHNQGAAFSFLHDASGWQRWFFAALGSVASVFIMYLLKQPGQTVRMRWALSFILGGALGNVIDRFTYGHVIDFIQVHGAGYAFPSFNLADSAITLGAGLLILDEIMKMRAPPQVSE
jgi:signal peptidase II